MKRYELLIFDWDGTLIDSEKTIVRCMQAALADIGAQFRAAESIRHIIGLGLSEAIQTLCPELDSDQTRQLVDRYRYHFLSSEPSDPFPGVAETLNRLSEQGYFMAVATGKGRQGLDTALLNTGFEDYFHITRCADETRSKPHPQMVLEILDYLGIESKKALMIGDTSYDLDMAKNAGIDSAAVSYGVHELNHLMKSEPKACFESMPEILNWLVQG